MVSPSCRMPSYLLFSRNPYRFQLIRPPSASIALPKKKMFAHIGRKKNCSTSPAKMVRPPCPFRLWNQLFRCTMTQNLLSLLKNHPFSLLFFPSRFPQDLEST